MDQTEIDRDRNEARNGIQVIARAAAVLRALKDSPTGLSLGQIAERVGLARSTVQRIVQALQDERLVIGSANGGGIRLGPELHSLAGAARFNVVERCRPFLEKLMEQTGETVDLSVLRGGRMIFLDQVQGRHRLRAVSSVGEVFPLTVTANGRACLSLLPEAEARKLAEAEWARGTATGNWAALERHLAHVRRTGLAEDDGEHTEGIIALGFAFTDLAGDLHAISVPVPTSRWPEMRGLITEALTALRAEITHIFEG